MEDRSYIFSFLYIVRTYSLYIVSSLFLTFIWPSTNNYVFYIFNAHCQPMYFCLHFGCLKLILQKVSQDGVTRTIYPSSHMLTFLYLCSVTLNVSFARCVILIFFLAFSFSECLKQVTLFSSSKLLL